MTDSMRQIRRSLGALAKASPVHEKPVPLVTGPPSRPAGPRRYYHDRQAGTFYRIEAQARSRSADRVLTGPEIQAYTDDVLSRPWPAWRAGPAWPVIIRLDQTVNVARYVSGEIIVPSPVHELVILHELAHHFTLSPRGDQHGVLFLRAMLDLIGGVMGDDAAQVFRDAFAANGVSS